LPFTLRELATEKPDIVVFDSIALWARMATTQLRLRAAASITHLVMDVRHLTRADKIRMLRQYLPKVPGILITRRRLIRSYSRAYPMTRPLFPMRGSLNVVFTIPELQPETRIIDDTFRFVGPSIDPQTRRERFPFDSLGTESVIYISLGTVHSRDPAFYRACFDAFGSVPRQFVLSVGHHTGLEALGPVPDNFIVRPAVPQLEVLQRADLFITHGGINSVHEGLYYGVPLVLVPHQFEQLLNARCVVGRGAGLIIHARMQGKPVTSLELRRALESALSDSGLRKSATKLQESMRGRGGYHEAASLIQAHASQPKPFPAA
jgi:MGT family glycosyltransferase